MGATLQVGADAAPASPPVGSPGELSRAKRHHPIRDMVVRRAALGVLTLLLVSIVIFAATVLLPGNAARAVLKNSATPERIKAVEAQLHLDRPAVVQYWTWMTGVMRGDFGSSLANGQSVSHLVGMRIENSAVLVVLAGVLGTVISLVLGMLAAARRDGWLDNTVSISSLAITALPEYVVAIVLVMIFATNVFHVLPAISVIPPGEPPWSEPSALVLPVATLVIVIIPYIFRMMRGAMIEALESDYVEMANLKGVRRSRVLMVHALPNAIAPTIQVIGLSILYLAGGIVVVEYVFNYPGIGQGLVNAVADRDIPMIQFIVLVLAVFYVFMNILSDVIALWVTPRRRVPR
ncbi:MAG TPA: ABC transporter permease [Thermoleophilia bacterium]|nr:ABC transporter permease [Thermoleophilia bacterium]